MWDINQTFKDVTQPRGKSSVFLDADKPLDPYHITYPVTWSGYFNNEKIEIVQNSSMSSLSGSYEFTTYPADASLFESEIIKAIDDLLRRALD